jgi:hypothetical protein
MKQLFIIAFILVGALSAFGQRGETVSIGGSDFKIQNLRLGQSTYIVYFKKTPASPADRLTLVRN